MPDPKGKENYPMTQQSSLLEDVFSHLNVAIAVVSPTLELLKTNTLFTNLFFSSDESFTNSTEELLHTNWQNHSIYTFLKNQFDDQQFTFDEEFAWDKQNGNMCHIQVKSQHLAGNGDGAMNILLIFSDITEQRENEKGRNQRIRFLMHELRNPLSNISLCVELLADSIKDNNQEEANMFLAKASNSVQRMKSIINDLQEARQNLQ